MFYEELASYCSLLFRPSLHSDCYFYILFLIFELREIIEWNLFSIKKIEITENVKNASTLDSTAILHVFSALLTAALSTVYN